MNAGSIIRSLLDPLSIPYKIRRTLAYRHQRTLYRRMRAADPELFAWADEVIGRQRQTGAQAETGGDMRPLKVVELYRLLVERRPQRVLELGTGGTTAAFARFARETGAQVTCADESQKWLDNARELAEAGAECEFVCRGRKIDVTLDPIEVRFDPPFEGPYDFVFIDGPSFWIDGVLTPGINTDIFELAALPETIVVDLRTQTVARIRERIGQHYEFSETHLRDLVGRDQGDRVRYFNVFRRRRLDS